MIGSECSHRFSAPSTSASYQLCVIACTKTSTALVLDSAPAPHPTSVERTPLYMSVRSQCEDCKDQAGLTAGLEMDQVPGPVRESPVFRSPLIQIAALPACAILSYGARSSKVANEAYANGAD